MDENKKESDDARAHAEGIKLALHDLANDERDTLRSFIAAVSQHVREACSKWVGEKFLALVGAALLTSAVWLISRKL